MLAYKTRTFCRVHNQDFIRTFVQEVREIQQIQGSRLASQFLINRVGLYPIEVCNESYYKTALDFEIALLYAHSGMQRQASELLDHNGILAAPASNYSFSDHVSQSLKIYEKTHNAARRGMPSLLICSLPKSASASLSQTLSHLTGNAVLRLSMGTFPNMALIESWVMRFTGGGAITHDHFLPSQHNLDILKRCGITRIVLQARDPRASLFSWLSMEESQQNQQEGNDYALEIYRALVAWLEGWIDAQSHCPWLHIEWVMFEEYKQAPQQVLARILSPYSGRWRMRPIMKKLKRMQAVDTANFRAGDDGMWRKSASDSLRAALWDALPQRVIEKMKLQP